MRHQPIKVKTAKNRSISSTSWLKRQLNDSFVLKAKADGYRSRAAYKLIEIDEKFSLIKPASLIIDLGAAPGGWSQICAKKLGKKGKIVAVDILEMQEMQGVEIIQGDFCDTQIQSKIIKIFTKKADIILSDMAPNTTGHKETDHLKIIDLCERVIDFTEIILNNGGSMILKIFQGGAQGELLAKIKKDFSVVKHFKPVSSRKDSSELYLIAMDYKKRVSRHIL
ncbi:MAG: RlmE family RNA methyltransferase [Rickettsiaceae bacterium]|nr:RlmE family RNA methyltransferase [Rickettsiaceae bacterium]